VGGQAVRYVMSKQLSNSPSYMRYIALRGLPLRIEPFKVSRIPLTTCSEYVLTGPRIATFSS
jgi:hypothetical protein